MIRELHLNIEQIKKENSTKTLQQKNKELKQQESFKLLKGYSFCRSRILEVCCNS